MRIAGIILFTFGVLATALLIVGAFTSAKTTSLGESIAMIFVFGNLPLITGALMIRLGRLKERKKKTDDTERALLRMAHKYGGRLTITIVAMETELSLDEARSLLSMFVSKGAADTEIDENGTIIYRFRELAAK